MDEIIIVKQLPIIEERLKEISEQSQQKVAAALAMTCTEDTVKSVKALRADLSKDFQELEKKRKDVKGKILAPYEQFEAVYRTYVTNIFKPADAQLKDKIDDVENGLKDQKKAEIAAFFDEYRESKNIDFITFEDSGINVTLSASKKSLKDQARAFVDKVNDDLMMIDTQNNSAEILVEYKRTLNASQAITIVSNRHKAIEEECRRFEQIQESQAAKNAAAQKVDAAIKAETPVAPESLNVPDAQPFTEEAPVQEELCEARFLVVHTLEKLKALKAFLIEGGYQFEQL